MGVALHRPHVDLLGTLMEGSTCGTCHGEEAPGCNICHGVQSSDLNGLQVHAFDGPSAPGHDFHTNFIGNCQLCHPSGTPGGPLPEPYRTCASCHTTFQNRGALHQPHVQVLEGVMEGPTCGICHGEQAPGCNICHGVESRDINGLQAHAFDGPSRPGHDFHTNFIGNCQFCHETEVPGGGPIPEPFGECASCHEGFMGPGQPLHQRHTQEFGAGDCNTCHGEDAPACNACHQVPQHDFTDFGAPGHLFHMNFIDNCQRCHVSGTPDVQLRIPFRACAQCHEHDSFQNRGELHREHVQDEGIRECTICHGADAPGCTSCHEHPVGEIHDEHDDEVRCSTCHSAGVPGGGFPGDGDRDRDSDWDSDSDRDGWSGR